MPTHGHPLHLASQNDQLPWPGGPRGFTMYFSDAGLRDCEAELEQFTVDAWRAPKRVLDAHPPDQHAEVRLRAVAALLLSATSNASSNLADIGSG
jgi:hypothetical protein